MMDENEDQTKHETVGQPRGAQTEPDGAEASHASEAIDQPVHEVPSAVETNTVISQETFAHPEQKAVAPQPKTNGLSTAGMVCGIVGVLFSIIPFVNFIFASLLGILATVFGAIARKQDGSGMAGIVLGVITLAITMLWAIGFLVFAVFMSEMDSSTF